MQTDAFAAGPPVFDAATPEVPANPNYARGYGILDAGSPMRPAPSRDHCGSVGTTTRPAMPPTRGMTRSSPSTSQYATRSAPAARATARCGTVERRRER